MGYETNRFSNGVSNEFICSICYEILHDPVKLSCCDHIYCRTCILPIAQSLDKSRRICPQDRKKIKKGIEDPPRVFLNLWKELLIKCRFSTQGCQEETALEFLDDHTKRCRFNVSTCHGNCGYRGPVSSDHNCIDYLKQLNRNHENTIDQMRKTIDGLNEVIEEFEQRVLKLTEKITEKVTEKKTETLFGRFRSSIRKFNCSRGLLVDELPK